MIWVSSSGVRARRISAAVQQLAEAGFTQLELSGGTEPYPELESDLLELAAGGRLRFQLHNYFPPPASPFVLNLASMDELILQASLEHVKRALDLSRKLGATRLAVHAGFRFDVPPGELGGALGERPLAAHADSLQRFVASLRELAPHAGSVRLYVENNVLSERNRRTWPGENPLLLCCAADWRELKPMLEPLGIGLLLDLAHLKVSTRSLGLDFETEAAELLAETDYLHLSDNDGLRDSNQELLEEGSVMQALRRLPAPPTCMTLEVYSGLEAITRSARRLEALWPEHPRGTP